MSNTLSALQSLKISCLVRGVRITKAAEEALSYGGKVPLTLREYATTCGIVLKLEDNIYINAPFDEEYCDPEAVLDVGKGSLPFEIFFRGDAFPASCLPLPGYIGACDTKGMLIKDATMSHADRVRLSPVYSGCSYRCQFCDLTLKKYMHKPVDQILEGYEIARNDKILPVKHAMISGGTPSQRDRDYIDDVYEKVIKSSALPVDVMLSPRSDDIIERLANWGVSGYSINIEVFDEDIASRLVSQKHRLSHKMYAESIERAIDKKGKTGKVRSMILVGLEPEEKTLAGVEFLARLGCDPVLSPFRPAPGTPLENLQPPSIELLERVYLKSVEIVERYGVKLGPRCIPCQHNTLTFPDGSDAYRYS